MKLGSTFGRIEQVSKTGQKENRLVFVRKSLLLFEYLGAFDRIGLKYLVLSNEPSWFLITLALVLAGVGSVLSTLLARIQLLAHNQAVGFSEVFCVTAFVFLSLGCLIKWLLIPWKGLKLTLYLILAAAVAASVLIVAALDSGLAAGLVLFGAILCCQFLCVGTGYTDDWLLDRPPYDAEVRFQEPQEEVQGKPGFDHWIASRLRASFYEACFRSVAIFLLSFGFAFLVPGLISFAVAVSSLAWHYWSKLWGHA
jgi:hypothetical protein